MIVVGGDTNEWDVGLTIGFIVDRFGYPREVATGFRSRSVVEVLTRSSRHGEGPMLQGPPLGEVAAGPWPKGPFKYCGSVGTIELSAQLNR